MQLLKVHWFVVVEFISCNQAEKIWANDYVKSAGSRVERSRGVFCTCEIWVLRNCVSFGVAISLLFLDLLAIR